VKKKWVAGEEEEGTTCSCSDIASRPKTFLYFVKESQEKRITTPVRGVSIERDVISN